MTIKSFLSKIILPLITLFIGLILGISLFYVYGKDYLLMMTGLQPVKYIIWESEEANEPYRGGNKEAARYALGSE
jgi:preprotein translocase subunit SecG